MEKITVNKKYSKKAEEFAEREYMCGAEERDALDKGYYWGCIDTEKELALTWEDIPTLIGLTSKVCREFCDAGRPGVPLEELYTEVLRRFNEQKYGKE